MEVGFSSPLVSGYFGFGIHVAMVSFLIACVCSVCESASVCPLCGLGFPFLQCSALLTVGLWYPAHNVHLARTWCAFMFHVQLQATAHSFGFTFQRYHSSHTHFYPHHIFALGKSISSVGKQSPCFNKFFDL